MVASGGMAEVWEARLDGPVGFAKRVAIKRLMPSLSDDDQFVALFLDEARLMASLTHPHICQVLELGEKDESYWVAMEFLAGHTAYQLIRETLKRGWRLPIELGVLIARDTAEALAYAHAKTDESGQSLGIIHRDVSPQNVMVTYEGVVKLVDFGIAKAATRTVITETGQLRGKMAYMPPEQARGEPLDGRADQFSLGATLFELVTHTRLYGTLKEMDLFREVAAKDEPLPRARSRAPELPEVLDEVLARTLERDREKRYGSMIEVRDALSAFLNDNSHSLPTTESLARYMASCFPPESRPAFTTQSGTPVSLSRPTAVKAQPRRRTAIIAAGLAAVVFVGVGVGALSSRPEPVVTPPPAPEPSAPIVAVTVPEVVPTPEPVADVDAGIELELAPIAAEPKPRPTVGKRVVAKPGFLSLQTTPWTLVFFGKKNLGETPLANVSLPAGVHRLKLVNDEKKLSTTIEVEIKPGQTTTKRLSF